MSQGDAWRLQLQNPSLAALEGKFREASALHQQGRLADAERVYNEVLRRQPGHFDALHRLGVLAAQTGQKERAAELFRRTIKLNGRIPAVHRNLGLALFELKRYKEALASFDKAIALKPDYVECYNSRGLVLQELGRFADAQAAFNKAIALKPDFAEAHWLGCSYVITSVAHGKATITNSFLLAGTTEEDKRFEQETVDVRGDVRGTPREQIDDLEETTSLRTKGK